MKEFWTLMTPWKKFKFILSIILILYILVFAFVNWDEQEINFIFFKIKISITLLILVCLVAGYLTSNIFDYKKYKSKEAEIRTLKNQLEELESKI
jgi:uncharacterized integral membrane protein